MSDNDYQNQLPYSEQYYGTSASEGYKKTKINTLYEQSVASYGKDE